MNDRFAISCAEYHMIAEPGERAHRVLESAGAASRLWS
jgi:hypothetical protein